MISFLYIVFLLIVRIAVYPSDFEAFCKFYSLANGPIVKEE